MADDSDLDTVIRCDQPAAVVGVVNRLLPALSPEVRRRLNYVKLHYLASEGVEGLFGRVNGRTVAEVLAAAAALPAREVVAEGERDGVRFTLYAPPASE